MSDYDRIDLPPSRERPWLRWLILFVLVFLAGLATMAWIMARWDGAVSYLSWLRPPQPVQEQASASSQAPQLVVAPVADTAPLERKVVELDNKMDTIAQRAEAASSNADRAEALLVAFVARRAIDRGLQLGYIEAMLRDRFAQAQPQAVATIISASHDPVTLEDLRGELEQLSPDLVGVGAKADWWAAFRREVAELIVIRREDTPILTPDARVERAKVSLNAGHVDRALAEIARLPAREKAEDWMQRARRYVAVHNALDLIEISALITPTRKLRSAAAPDNSPAPAPAPKP